MVINWVDLGILGSIGFSSAMGGMRGFVKEAISLVTWVTALLIGWFYAPLMAPYFSFVSMPWLQLAFGFLSLVLAALVVGGLINYLVGKLIVGTGFSATDKLIGFLFGTCRGLLMISLSLVFLEGHLNRQMEAHQILKNSGLLPHFQGFARQLKTNFREQWPDQLKRFWPDAEAALTPRE